MAMQVLDMKDVFTDEEREQISGEYASEVHAYLEYDLNLEMEDEESGETWQGLTVNMEFTAKNLVEGLISYPPHKQREVIIEILKIVTRPGQRVALKHGDDKRRRGVVVRLASDEEDTAYLLVTH